MWLAAIKCTRINVAIACPRPCSRAARVSSCEFGGVSVGKNCPPYKVDAKARFVRKPAIAERTLGCNLRRAGFSPPRRSAGLNPALR